MVDVPAYLRLVLLQRCNLFFDGVFGDQPVDKHWLILTDAVSPVRRLQLGGQVPPGVIMYHGIRARKIESHAPDLEANQEYRGIAALDLRVVGGIFLSWVGTLPLAAGLSIGFYYLFLSFEDWLI